MTLKLETNYLEGFLSRSEIDSAGAEAMRARAVLMSAKTDVPGADFRGWVDLPQNYDRDEFARIKAAAKKIRSDSSVLVVVGIGGSYLGARACIEFINSRNYNLCSGKGPQIFFVGNSLDPTDLKMVLEKCAGCDFSVNVISKSGTTTEPAIAFRLLKKLLTKKYGSNAAQRIYVTTDKSRGTLKKEADELGYSSFVVPDNVGGRYSVLTAVGLLPIACAGIDIDALMSGACAAMKDFSADDFSTDLCCRYACIRNLLYRSGKTVEMFVSYETDFAMMNEWLKQLFGESEGKDNKGIFPASVIYSTDLHSMGQFVQDGSRLMFETDVLFDETAADIVVEREENDDDGLNYLSGRSMTYINRRAFEGTVLAHNDGGVPNIVIRVKDKTAFSLGYLIYFFEKSCAVSGYMLGVNPFDQPGVESYKKNMFALLGRPGYEAQTEALRKRIAQ